MLPSWLRQLFKKRFVGQGATTPILTKLAVESLEERALLSVSVWTGGTIANAGGQLGTNSVNAKWSDPGNWAGGVPRFGDDVLFPGPGGNDQNGNPRPTLDAAHKPPSTGQGSNFQWLPNSVIDQNFTIGNLTIEDDNYHIDAFFGTNPTLTVRGTVRAAWPEALGPNTGLSLIGPLFGNSSLTMMLDPIGPTTTTNFEAFHQGNAAMKINVPIQEAANQVGIIKTGNGTFMWSQANSYTGASVVHEGTLIVGGSAFGLGGSALGTSVDSGATLGLVAANGIGDALAIAGDGFGGVGALDGASDPSPLFSGGAFGIGGPSTVTGNVTLLDAASIGAHGSSITITGQVTSTGAGTLTKIGGNNLILTNVNTYNGDTFINQGTLTIRNNEALSTQFAPQSKTVVASGANLSIDGSLTVAETLELNGDGFFDPQGNPLGALQLIRAAAQAVWTGTVTLVTNSSIGVVNSNLANVTTLLTITGALLGQGNMTKVNQGTLRFPFANLGFGGNTFVNNGVLQIADAKAIGPGSGKITVNSMNNVQGTLQLEGAYTMDQTMELNGAGFASQGALRIIPSTTTGAPSAVTWGGPINLGSPTFVRVDPTDYLAIAGGLSSRNSAASFDKFGTGLLDLVSDNTLTSTITLREGETTLETAGGLGASSTGSLGGTIISAGATLRLPSPLTVDGESLTISGKGTDGTGALKVPAGSSAWTGLVTLLGLNTTEADINVASGGQMNFTNSVGGDADLRKLGLGELDLTGTTSNTSVKSTFIDQGTLALGKSAGLNALGGSIIVGDGLGGNNADVLRLDSSEQIPNTLSVIVKESGLFNLNGHTETLGGTTAVTLTGGEIQTGAGGMLNLNGNLLTTGSLEQSVISGTLNLNGTSRTFNFSPTPTLTVASSQNAAVYGTSITFTLSATAAPGGQTPTGTFRVFDNGVELTTPGNPIPLTQGFTTSALLPGNHNITFLYSGDNNYPPVTVALANVQKVLNPPEQSLVSSNINPADPNQDLTFTDRITGLGAFQPTGFVQFKADGVNLGGLQTLVNGVASITTDITNRLTPGVHVITAEYSGDPNFAPATTTLAPNQVVGDIPTVQVTSNAEPDMLGQSVTFTFKATGSGASPPSGTVTFFDTFFDQVTKTTVRQRIPGQPVGGIGLTTVGNAGVATISTSTLIIGNHTITAEYSGDATFAPATATLAPGQSVVNPLVVELNSSPDPAQVNGQITYTFRANGGAGQPTPTGTVDFIVNGSTFTGVLTPAGVGVATASITAGAPFNGTYTVSATFRAGDNNYLDGQTVTLVPPSGATNSTFFVQSSVNSALLGTTVTYTVIDTANPRHSGSILFLDGPNPIAGQPPTGILLLPNANNTANIASISVTYNSTASIGTHNITGRYLPAAGSPYPTVDLKLGPAEDVVTPLTTTLSSSADPVAVGNPVTFTFTATQFAGGPTPGGTVTFFDNGSPIAGGINKPLNGSGVATVTTSALAQGTHTITALYAGNNTYAAQATTLLPNQVVVGTVLQTDLTSNDNSALFGDPVTFTFTGSGGPSSSPPTGTVDFFDNGVAIGVTQNLVGGTAVVTTNLLAAGAHNITAVYSGDAVYAPAIATLNPGQRVVERPLVQLRTSATQNTINQNQSVALTFTAAPTGTATTLVPTGDVVFTLTGPGGPFTFTGTLNATGVATVTVPANALTPGTYTATAAYTATTGGVVDPNYEPVTVTLTPALTVQPTGSTLPPPAPPANTVISAPPILVVNATIVGGAGVGIVKAGAGNMILNANSTYGGSTVVNGANGTLTLGTNNALPTGTSVQLSNGTLDVNGKTQTVAQLTGATGGVLALTGGGTLTTGGNGVNTTVSGPLSGNGTLVKVGAGTLTLAGDSSGPPPASAPPTFTGTVNTMGGTVNVTNDLSAGAFTVQNTGTLGGTGTTGAITGNAGSVVSPGVIGANGNIGVLTASGPVTLAAGDTLAIQINGAGAAGALNGFDQLKLTNPGTISLNNATLGLTLNPAFSPNVGTQFVIVDAGASGTVNGTFRDAAGNPLTTFTSGSRVFSVTYSANQVVLQVTAVASTMTLTSNDNPAAPGDTVAFTYTVTPVSATDPVPTGTVTLNIDGTAFASNVPLVPVGGGSNASRITFNVPATAVSGPPPALDIGSHVVQAVYTSTNPQPYQSGTTTLTPNEVVSIPTTTTVAPSGSVSYVGETVILTAVVSGAGGPPTGVVSFFNATTGAFLGNATLNGSGVAQLATTGFRVGANTIQAVYDGDGTFRTSSGVTTETVDRRPLYAAGSGAGGIGFVTAYNGAGTPVFSALPFGVYAGGVKVAVGDVNGDGVNDLVAMAGPGALNGLVIIYDGTNFAPMNTFAILGAPGFPIEFNLAVGDITGDGQAEVIFGTATGLDLVGVYSGSTLVSLTSAFAPVFGAFGFTGGVNVATGDVNGDGRDELIYGTASGFAFATVNDAATGALMQAYFVGLPGGASVAAGDVNGDRRDDVIVGTTTGISLVQVYDGASLSASPAAQLLGIPATTGARVAAADRDGDRKADIIVGDATTLGLAAVFSGTTLSPIDFIFLPGGGNGINVAGR